MKIVFFKHPIYSKMFSMKFRARMVEYTFITKLSGLICIVSGVEIHFIAPTAGYHVKSFGETIFFLAI